MSEKSQKLMDLFIQLLECENRDDIIEQFVSGMEEIYPDIRLQFSDLEAADSQKISFPVKSDDFHFGYIYVGKKSEKLDKELTAELKKACAWLAQILEKVTIQQIAIEERNQLEKLVEEERKRIEEISSRHYMTLNLINAGVWIVNQNAELKFVNDAFARLLGYDVDELIGKPLFDLTDAEGVKIAQRNLRRRLAGKKKPKEFKFVHKNGEPVFVRMDISQIFDERGNYLGAVAGAVDVTEKRKVRETIKQAERRFQTFFEHQPNYCYMVSVDGKILDANRAACKALGMTKKELIGKSVLSIYARESREKARQLFELWKQTGSIHGEELQIQSASGEKRDVILNATAVRDKDNAILHFIVVHQDITEEKYFQRSIIKLTEFATTLTDFPADQDIFEFIGESISQLVNNGIVAVNVINQENGSLELKQLHGMTPQQIRFVEETLDVDLKNLIFPDLPQKVTSRFSEGRLKRLEQGLYDVFMKKVARSKCKIVEKELGISSVYVIGLRKGDSIYGNITIFAGKKTILFDDIIETFVNYAANTLSRLESEAQLRLSQQRLDLALESTGIALWDQDFVSGKVYRSKQWAEMLGYSIEEIEESIEPWFKMIHPEDLKEVEKITRLHESGKIPFIKIEHRMRAKNGEWRWIQNWGKIVDRDEKGEPLRAVGTHIDVTDRKAIELELLKSKTRLETIFENAPVGIRVMNADGSGFRANKKYYQITGEKPPDESGEVPTGKIHPDDKQKVDELFYKALAGEIEFRHQFRILRDDGEVRHVLGQIFRQQTESGEVLGYISTITDITSQIEAQLALQEREATLRSIFRSAPIGIGMVINRKMVQVNDYFCKLVGYERKELIGQSTRILFPDDETYELVEKGLLPAIQKKGVASTETKIKTRQGKFREILASFSAIDASNLSKGIIFTVLDVTQRKKAEQELRHSEQQYRTLVETIPDIILIFDKKFRIQFASPSLENQLGFTINDFEQPKRGFEFVYEEDIAETRRKVVDFLKKPLDISPPIEFRIRDKHGRLRWYSSLFARTEYKGELAFLIVARDVTLNKEIEAKLRESERRFATFMDELPAAVCIMNADSVLLYVNKFAAEIFDAYDWIGTPCYQHFPDEVGKKMRENDLMTLKRGILHVLESLPDRNGTMRIFDTRKFVLKEEAGERLIGAISLDISEQVKAEEALVASERKYRTLFNAINEGVALHEMVYDENGKGIDYRILDVNPAFEKITELKEEQVVGKLASEVYQMTPPPFLAVYSHVAETRRALLFENYFEDISKHFLVAVFSPQKGQFATAFLDITEAKEAERALKENEERFRLIVENIPVLVDAFDEDGNIIFWNKECERVTGYSKVEIVNNPNALNLLYPDQEFLKNLLREWEIRKDDFSGWEIPLTTKEGKERIISWHNISARVPIPGWASWAIGIDVTEQKYAEAQIKKYTEELEDRVRERTRELEEKTVKLEKSQEAMRLLLEDVNESRAQLERVNQQLQAANLELESFAYSVSHDLRAPLRHIDGFSELLLSEYAQKLEGKAKYYLETVAEAAKEMAHLIESLLQFSRMGRVSMSISKRDMNEIVEYVLDKLKYATEGRKIEWKIEKLPEVECDEMLMRQVWVNLIGNAIKFTRTKKIAKIEIKSEQNEEEFIFSIKDNGVGFDMQFADKLFGVFQRLHSKKDFEGIGIGLANVKRIIQRHGGKIWAEGKVDKGAIFYFTLPKQRKEFAYEEKPHDSHRGG